MLGFSSLPRLAAFPTETSLGPLGRVISPLQHRNQAIQYLAVYEHGGDDRHNAAGLWTRCPRRPGVVAGASAADSLHVIELWNGWPAWPNRCWMVWADCDARVLHSRTYLLCLRGLEPPRPGCLPWFVTPNRLLGQRLVWGGRFAACGMATCCCRGRPVMAGAGPSVSGTRCSSRCIWFWSLTVMTWRDRHRDVKSGVGPGELGRHCTPGFHPSKTWFVFRHRCFDPHDHGVHPLFVITCMFSMQRIFIFPKLASPNLPESPCRLVLHLLVNSLRSWRMTSGSIVWWWTISWTWSWKAWVTSVTTLLRSPSWRRPSFIDEVCQLASAWSRPLRHGVTSFPGTVSASQSLPTSCRLTLLAVFELWELRRFASRPSSYGSLHEHWHTDGCGSLSQSCPFLGPFFGLG